MHIAWIGKKTPFCGNVTYGREVTNALLDRGHQVSFFHFATESDGSKPISSTPERGGDPVTALAPYAHDWETDPESRDVSLPCLYKSQIYTIPDPKAAKVLTDALHSLQPDLVHASLTLSPMDFVLPEICGDLRIPLLSTFHPAFDRRRRNIASHTQHLAYQIYAPFLANYDRTIVFSQVQRDVLVKLGLRPEQVVAIPNGVDVDKYSPGPSRFKETLEADRLFVYQGRIAPEKNVEALLKAWKQAQLGERCKLVMIGDGPLASTLKSFYHQQHGVIWLGYVGDEQRRIDILRGCDVFILPSLIEGLSLSLLEAMACGLAVVATDVGADGEVLADGAGILLEPQRVTADLLTLLPLLRDQTEFTQLLGVKARQRVLQRYTLSGNITQLEQTYAQLLPSRGIPPLTRV
ncbi:MAG: glycosyltransferase family 4 protein [Cyanobacteriota bacterium]|nr:glycosyltransferase family 4 protein [Cyanobacteriota bacterium]